MKASRLGAIATLMESGDTAQAVKAITGSHDTRAARVEVRHVPVASLSTSPWQPRHGVNTEGEDFQALMASVRDHGVMQPVVVRELPDKTLQLIAGERRLVASRLLGLATIPARIYSAADIDEHTARAMSVVENLARTDLSTWEEAQALAQLRTLRIEAGIESNTVRELGVEVGRSKSQVARLLRIAEGITEDVRSAAYALAGDARNRDVSALSRDELLSVADTVPEKRVAVLATLLRPAPKSTREQPVEAPTVASVPAGDTAPSRAPFTIEGDPRKRLRVRFSGRIDRLSADDAAAFLDALQPVVRALRQRAKGDA